MNYSNIEFHWDDRKEILVLAEDNKSVCRIHIYKDEVNTAYLTDLHVLEEVRQQGTLKKEDDTHIVLEHPMFGCINIYRLHVHKLQHAIRMLGVDDKAKIVMR